MSRKQYKKKHQSNVVDFKRTTQPRTPRLIPKSENQKQYIHNLLDCHNDIIIAYGPAGTGKTYLAVQAAIKCLQEGTCKKIILTRPAVGVDDEQHGFLPGTLEEKMAPWTRPLLDVMKEYYSTFEIDRMFEEGILEISPLAYMRGRTFKDAWIIGDEMQNTSPDQMKMLLTRIGRGSRIVITGDIEQTDKGITNNGLVDLTERLKESVPGINVSVLDKCDIQRHKIISSILKIYS